MKRRRGWGHSPTFRDLEPEPGEGGDGCGCWLFLAAIIAVLVVIGTLAD